MDAVTVNIVVHDTQCATYMDHVSVQVLFLCTQCTHASRTLPVLVEHIRSCALQPIIKESINSGNVDTSKMLLGGFNEHGSNGIVDNLVKEDLMTQKELADTKRDVSESGAECESLNANMKKENDIEHKLSKLIELLNEMKYIDTADQLQIESKYLEMGAGDAPGSNLRLGNEKCVHVELIKDTHPNGENDEIKKVKKQDNPDENMDADEPNEADIDDVMTHFYDDTDNDPDFVPSSKSVKMTSATSNSDSEYGKADHGSSSESEVDVFIKQYIEFISKSVDDLYRQENAHCDDIKKGLHDLPSIVYDKRGNFDFTVDKKPVLKVPGLESHKLPAKSWRCVDCPEEELLSSVDLDFHTKCHDTTLKGKFKCHLCKRRSAKTHLTSWSTVRSHLASVHDIDFQIPCINCHETMSSVEQLDTHRKRYHKITCKYKKQVTKSDNTNNIKSENVEDESGTSETGNNTLVNGNKENATGSPSKKHVPCHVTCFDKEEMDLHERCHDPDNASILRCPVCGFSGSGNRRRYQTIRHHIETEHPDILSKKFSCPGCGEGFHNESTYKEHYYTCVKIKHLYHRCMFCTHDNSLPVVAMEDHLVKDRKLIGFKHKVRKAVKMLNDGKTMHEIYAELLFKPSTYGNEKEAVISSENNIESESKGYKCSLCYKKLKTKTSFERHMFKCHPDGNDETICQTCGRLFRTKNQYRNHYIQVHQGLKRKALPRSARKNTNAAKTDETGHTKSTETPTLIKCTQCDYTSPHQTRVRNHHMSVHMGILPYKCTKCDYATNEVSDLRRHQNKHLGIKRYACDHCDYKASHHWLLVVHSKRQHDVEVPKKRKAFNFMGSEGSMRWQRKREKERDLKQRMNSVYPPSSLLKPEVGQFEQGLETVVVRKLSGESVYMSGGHGKSPGNQSVYGKLPNAQDVGRTMMSSAELDASRIINSVAPDEQEQFDVLMDTVEANVIDDDNLLNIVEQTEPIQQGSKQILQGSVMTNQSSIVSIQGSSFAQQGSIQVQQSSVINKPDLSLNSRIPCVTKLGSNEATNQVPQVSVQTNPAFVLTQQNSGLIKPGQMQNKQGLILAQQDASHLQPAPVLTQQIPGQVHQGSNQVQYVLRGQDATNSRAADKQIIYMNPQQQSVPIGNGRQTSQTVYLLVNQ